MKLLTIPTAIFIAAISMTSSLFAIDRDSKMIDTAWFDGTSYDNYSYYGLRITGENTVEGTDGKWALLASVMGGSFSPDFGSDSLALGGKLGIKYYAMPLTGIALLGGYTWNDSDDYNYDIGEFTLRLKQRFIDAAEPISPYIKLEAGLQFADLVDSDNIAVYRAFVGCDFAMSDTMDFVFEGGYAGSDNLDDGIDTEDGWNFRFGMQYHWN